MVRMALLVVGLGCLTVVPFVSCLSLPQQQQQQQQQQQPGEPPLLSQPPRPPPRHLHRLLPPDYRYPGLDSNQALSRLEEAQLLRELEDPTSPAAYRLQQVISQVAEEAVNGGGVDGGGGGINDVVEALTAAASAGSRGGDEPWTEPRYYLLDDYLTTPDEAGSSSTDINNFNNIRKARNSLDINNNNNNNNKDSSASGSTETTNTNINNTGLNKRTWPHGFSRRRSGLSLSIDASMKVLREALYLEIARKKQRQQLQRAQHNKALLNSIGKRDVSAQLRTPARDSSPSFSSSSSSSTPTLAERN